jgi:hypothetical protein
MSFLKILLVFTLYFTAGMIKGAILQSCSAFTPACITYSDAENDVSKQTAIHFNCATAAQWDQHNGAQMAQMLQVRHHTCNQYKWRTVHEDSYMFSKFYLVLQY